MVTKRAKKLNGTAAAAEPEQGLVPAAGYLRNSSDQQKDSRARQRADVEAMAEREGYRIVKWYEDAGMTGTESAKRADFQQMLKDAGSGTFRAVLISEQSRLSREDVLDVMDHFRQLRKAGVSLVTCHRGKIDLDSLGGLLTAIVEQHGAREESLKLSSRVVSGMRQSVARGQKRGKAPFGYDNQCFDAQGRPVLRVSFREKFTRPKGWTAKLVPSSETRAVEAVRYMFEQVAAGNSRYEIAKELNRRRIPACRGGRWTSGDVYQVVTNVAYAGVVATGHRTHEGYGKFNSLREEGGVRCEGAHEPLVSQELFDRARRLLTLPDRHRPRSSRQAGVYLLTRLVYFEDGRRLYGQSSNHGGGRKRYRYYAMCKQEHERNPEEIDHPYIRADVLEQAVVAKVAQALNCHVSAITDEVLSRKAAPEGSTEAALRFRLREVRELIERGARNLLLAPTPADFAVMARQQEQLRQEEADLQAQLRAAQASSSMRAEDAPAPQDFPSDLSEAPLAVRAALASALRLTIKRVTLRRVRRSYGRSVHRPNSGQASVNLWSGSIELYEDVAGVACIPLSVESFGQGKKWMDVVRLAREKGAIRCKDVVALYGHSTAAAFKLLTKGVLAGLLVRNPGKNAGWSPAPAS
jgi:DNA invertase Pin-like site-specific DNA recombinase